MPIDDEWVSNVKRWCLQQRAARTEVQQAPADPLSTIADDEVGYEAAHPSLQARHWPDASIAF